MPSSDVHSVKGNAHVDYECVCGDFVDMNMMCRLSLSKVLIGIGCICVNRNECISVCVCTMVRKEKNFKDTIFFIFFGETDARLCVVLAGLDRSW